MPETYCSAEIAELAAAMVKVQQALTPVCKDAENPFSKSRYSTLNSVIEACRDALIAHGIWVVQVPVPVESGHLGLMTKLVHTASGQWQASLMVMPLPKADPQGYGSALTYARRYGLATLVGLVSEADDDAVTAMPHRGRTVKSAPAKPSAPAEEPDPVLATLPRIDGVTYATVQAGNGRTCITASGNTQAKKAFLQEAGFRWDAGRKIWWRYAEDQAAA
jgi:hypothetical protein